MRVDWTDAHRLDLHQWLQQYQADILDRDYAQMPNRLARDIKAINGFLEFVTMKVNLETPDVSGSACDSTV